MKVIDLLNKIAEGEAPEQIKYNGDIYNYNRDNNVAYMYTCDNLDINLFRMLDSLNEQVEVIEKEKDLDLINMYFDNDLEEYVAETFTNNNLYKEVFNSKYDEMLINKINELIRNQKKIISKLEDNQ